MKLFLLFIFIVCNISVLAIGSESIDEVYRSFYFPPEVPFFLEGITIFSILIFSILIFRRWAEAKAIAKEKSRREESRDAAIKRTIRQEEREELDRQEEEEEISRLYYLGRREEIRITGEYDSFLDEMIKLHIETLVRKKYQSYHFDDYGIIIDKEWRSETKNFFSVIDSKFDWKQAWGQAEVKSLPTSYYTNGRDEDFHELIDSAVNKHIQEMGYTIDYRKIGEDDDERIRMISVPTNCSSCGAGIGFKTIYQKRELLCEYCGSGIRIKN